MNDELEGVWDLAYCRIYQSIRMEDLKKHMKTISEDRQSLERDTSLVHVRTVIA
jgi:hypothetical protein